jgi:hypothetical protein
MKWPQEDVEVMLSVYPQSGAVGVRRRLRHRTLRSIQQKAIVLGLAADREDSRCERDFAGLPGTTLVEQLDCVRLRKWRGPVNDGPLVPSLGRRAA